MSQMQEDGLALQTLSALEARLKRIEFALVGDTSNCAELLQIARNKNRDHSLNARLSALEGALSRLSNKSKTVKDILQLYSTCPEIFTPTLAAAGDPTALSSSSSTLTPEEKLSTLLAVVPSFQTTSSQLILLKDSPIPAPSLSAELIELQPRIDKVAVVHETQARELAELRSRSIKVLERWYLVGIEGVNECFAEWDDRTRNIDKIVARKAHEQD